jgi:hypothetical protein
MLFLHQRLSIFVFINTVFTVKILFSVFKDYYNYEYYSIAVLLFISILVTLGVQYASSKVHGTSFEIRLPTRIFIYVKLCIILNIFVCFSLSIPSEFLSLVTMSLIDYMLPIYSGMMICHVNPSVSSTSGVTRITIYQGSPNPVPSSSVENLPYQMSPLGR